MAFGKRVRVKINPHDLETIAPPRKLAPNIRLIYLIPVAATDFASVRWRITWSAVWVSQPVMFVCSERFYRLQRHWVGRDWRNRQAPIASQWWRSQRPLWDSVHWSPLLLTYKEANCGLIWIKRIIVWFFSTPLAPAHLVTNDWCRVDFSQRKFYNHIELAVELRYVMDIADLKSNFLADSDWSSWKSRNQFVRPLSFRSTVR